MNSKGQHHAKDVTEWLDLGHTIEELQQLTQKTSPWSPSSIDEPLPSGHGSSIDEILIQSGLKSLGDAADPATLESALLALRELVRDIDPLRLAVLREEAIKALKRSGHRAPVSLVDAAIGPREIEEATGTQAQVLMLSDPEPWPDPVDGADLMNDLMSTFRRFLHLPPGGALALCLWILHAHTHESAAVTPLLVLKSAAKRSGKTTALTVIYALVPRPLIASNVTPAVIFRAIDKYHPTLLIDEADSFLTANEEIRGILNSGHTRSGAVVIRTVGDNFEPHPFSTWGPKAIALIGNLPGTLEDRAVIIEMQRRARSEKVERLRLDRLDELEPLRRKAARWGKDQMEALRHADPIVPEELNDRAADNWRSMLGIADQCGGVWPDDARHACLKLSGAAVESDNTPGIQLLADLRDLFCRKREDRLSSKQIVEALATMEDRPWPEWSKGKPLTETQLAKLLKPFGVKPKGIRLKDDTTPRGYLRADLEDSFSRYLPPEVQHLQHVNVINNLGPDAKCNTNIDVAPREFGQDPCQMGLVAGVAPPKPESGKQNGKDGDESTPSGTDQ